MKVKELLKNKAVIATICALAAVALVTGIVCFSASGLNEDGTGIRFFTKSDGEGNDGLDLIDRYGTVDNTEYLNETAEGADSEEVAKWSQMKRTGMKLSLGEEGEDNDSEKLVGNGYGSDSSVVYRGDTLYGYDDVFSLEKVSATDIKNLRTSVEQDVMNQVKQYYSQVTAGINGRDGVDGRDGKDGAQGQNGQSIPGAKGATGATGAAGKAGIDGKDGVSSYTHVKYATDINGSGMTSTPSNNTSYIGIAVTTTNAAPSYASAYTWSLYRGASGSDGVGTFIFYATDGSGSNASLTVSAASTYMQAVTAKNSEEAKNRLSATGWVKYTGDNTYIFYSAQDSGHTDASVTPMENVKYMQSASGSSVTEAKGRLSDSNWVKYVGTDGETGESGNSTYIFFSTQQFSADYTDLSTAEKAKITESPSEDSKYMQTVVGIFDSASSAANELKGGEWIKYKETTTTYVSDGDIQDSLHFVYTPADGTTPATLKIY